MHQISRMLTTCLSGGQGGSARGRERPLFAHIRPLIEGVRHLPERLLQARTRREDLSEPVDSQPARRYLDRHLVEVGTHLALELRHLVSEVEADPVAVDRVIGDLVSELPRDLHIAPCTRPDRRYDLERWSLRWHGH